MPGLVVQPFIPPHSPSSTGARWSLGLTGGSRGTTAPCLAEPRATESWATALVESPRSSWGCPTALQTGWVQKAVPPCVETVALFLLVRDRKTTAQSSACHPCARSKTQGTQPISSVPTRGPGHRSRAPRWQGLRDPWVSVLIVYLAFHDGQTGGGSSVKPLESWALPPHWDQSCLLF